MVQTHSTGILDLDQELRGGFPEASLIGTFGFYGDLETLFVLTFLRKGLELDENVLYVSSFDSEFVFWQKIKDWGITPNEAFHFYKIPDTSLSNFPGIIREVAKLIEDNRIIRLGIELTPLLQVNDPSSVFVSIGRLKDLVWRHKIVGLLSLTKGTTKPETRVSIQSVLDGIIDILPSNLPAQYDGLFKVTKMKNTPPMMDYKGFHVENGNIIIREPSE
ncbi:MAG: RAD55 family ATPase [Candidatus Hodarchaeota archaeon]